MNNNNHPSLYFSPHSLKALKQEPAPTHSIQTPYLRAVLTDKKTDPARVLSMTNSSLAAALRYIANSK